MKPFIAIVLWIACCAGCENLRLIPDPPSRPAEILGGDLDSSPKFGYGDTVDIIHGFHKGRTGHISHFYPTAKEYGVMVKVSQSWEPGISWNLIFVHESWIAATPQ